MYQLLIISGLKTIEQAKDPRLFRIGHDLKVPDYFDLLKESVIQQLQPVFEKNMIIFWHGILLLCHIAPNRPITP